MGANLTDETLRLLKAAQAQPNADLAKSITQATLLTAYDLQAPAKNLYPVITPIRNVLPRVSGGTGPATNWRVVSAITGSGLSSAGWVPEGQRTARMSYTTASKSATYVTLGEEDQVSYEAIAAGVGFEDVQARMTMRLLQQMMIKEEHGVLGGNNSVALGTPTAPTCSASGSGGTLPTLTYDVSVVALTYEGFQAASLAGGLSLSPVITGADGLTYTLNGGTSQKSTVTTQAVTLGQNLFASTPAIKGAVAYAWFIGGAGAGTLQLITTINSCVLSVPIVGGRQAVSAGFASDLSVNATLAYNGLLYAGPFSDATSYFNSLATGAVSGTGTFLTASGRGSVNEIDVMLKTMWDTRRVSPDVIYCNSQEILNITNKVFQGPASQPNLPRYNDPTGAGGVSSTGYVTSYINPFTTAGAQVIPVRIHPFLPAGTIIAWSSNLPAQYQSNQVPNVAEVKTRRDYYQINWPIVTRQQQVGVYSEQVLAVYAPFAMGVITNIGNG